MMNIKVTVGSVVIAYEKKRLKAIMRRAGSEVAAIARKNIRTATGGGRLYYGPGGSAAKYRGGYEKGQHSASAPGASPASITGTLARSIVVRPFKSGEGVAIRDTAFYALFLEMGAKGGGRRGSPDKKVRGKKGVGASRVLAPRPFLSAALDARASSIEGRIEEAVLQDIQFRRLRA